MTDEADDFKHPRCYANTRGGCSAKISGEHYVSLGLLRLYEDDNPDFTVQHKAGKGIGNPVPPKVFVANILCKKHNESLSPADAAAVAFAKFLRRNALQYDAGAGEWGDAEEVTISGDDMQRWLLKLLLNHVVTGHLHEQREHKLTFPPEAIDLLLNRAAWPSEWGLTVPGSTDNHDVRYCPFQTKEVVDSHWWGCSPFIDKDNTWVGGGVIDLAHVSFGLTLFNPGRQDPRFNNPLNPLRGSLQRPKYIGWELEGVEKRINFAWDYPLHSIGITYTLTPQNKADRLAGQQPVGRQTLLE
ncbi:hypothetical protein [Mycolicibacterium rhodesiae]|uniref:hypothetical protein n=1 Tax=Mycolicibacterium rhodesiae TaxID=36814 RepID=UPI001055C880|nr:hypothetical protein [Mycolicibacterium rhodesiae]MCV7343801.1 hypothetical protein [Mycolicibacterium rhodesiae]